MVGRRQFIGVGVEREFERHDLLAHEPAHHRNDEILLGGRRQLHGQCTPPGGAPGDNRPRLGIGALQRGSAP